jgi:hypothetical protein
LECLNPEGIHLEMDKVMRTFPGIIEKVEVRLDGVCKTCLRNNKKIIQSITTKAGWTKPNRPLIDLTNNCSLLLISCFSQTNRF